MSAKRYRVPSAKPGQLIARFGKVDSYNDPSIVYAWGSEGASKPDSRLLSEALERAPVYDGRSLVEELEARGYDLTTLKFSIQMKQQSELSHDH